jgi:hypothetical protein
MHRDLHLVGAPIAFSIVVALAAACAPAGEAGGPAATRVDSAGVTLVTSTGEDRTLRWSFEEVASIGGADEGPNSFFDVPEHSIEIASNGDVYILDAGNGRVLRFDSLGTPLGAIATQGEGPDELRRPQSMALDLRDRVTVLDMPRLGVVTFTAEGDPVGEMKLDIPFGKIAYFKGGLLHPGASSFQSVRDSIHRSLAWRVTNEDRELARMARPRPTMVDYGCIGLAQPPLFTPEFAWGTNGRIVAVSGGDGYDIGIFEGEDVSARYRRDVPPRPVTRELAIDELGDGSDIRSPAGTCHVDPVAEVEGRGFHEVLPPVADVAVDPDGRLWVERAVFRGETPRIDILAADGAYVGTIENTDVFPSAFLTPDLFLALTKDELDVQYVKLFRVRREY